MKEMRTSGTSTAALISFLLIYIILIALILIFARQIISDASLEDPVSGYLVLPLALLLPFFILIAIGIYVIRLLRDHKRGRAGAGLKIRLMIFFTIITLLSSIPQGILSISFIEIAMQRWFSSPVAGGLEGGVDLILEYNQGKVDALKTAGSSPLLSDALRDIERSPDLVWDRVRSSFHGIHALQIFDADGDRFFGDDRARATVPDLADRGEGLLPTVIYRGNYSVLRYLRHVVSAGREYIIVLSSIVPGDFNRKAERLTAASDTFNQIELFQPLFRLVLVVFYSVFSIPLILLAILISFLLSDEVVRPIAGLEAATRRVAEGDFSYRILGRGRHGLATLVRSFNTMVSEIERSRNKLLQTEKVSAWQEIAQRMAHEIKNPLTPIKLNAQRILHRYKKDPESVGRIIETAVDSIVGEVENLNNLLQEFRDFARLPQPTLEKILILDLVREVLDVYKGGVRPNVEVDCSGLDGDMAIYADRSQLKRVFSNLIKNAFEATGEGGTVSIRSDLVRKGNTRYCRIQVKDTGEGIDTEFYGQVFNPYFTTKEAGTGLGLPIVERIVFDHEGQIWFETEKGVGTTFFIDLPWRENEQRSDNR